MRIVLHLLQRRTIFSTSMVEEMVRPCESGAKARVSLNDQRSLTAESERSLKACAVARKRPTSAESDTHGRNRPMRIHVLLDTRCSWHQITRSSRRGVAAARPCATEMPETDQRSYGTWTSSALSTLHTILYSTTSSRAYVSYRLRLQSYRSDVTSYNVET